jgi:catechol 2,3-dioxygenase
MGLQKVAHVQLRVDDLDRAVDFHVNVLGLTELSRNDGSVYLGCGFDTNNDVILTPGGTGVERVTLQVDSDEDIQRYAKRLADLGITNDVRTDEKPGQSAGLNFTLPSGQGMELAVVSDRRPYLHTTTAGDPQGRGIAPFDIDHVTLMGPDIQKLMHFLKQTLDFKLSDIIRPGGDVWAAAWARTGEYHHDVAAIHSDNPNESLHHLAWSFANIEQIKQAADLLARNNIKIEAGPGRHTVGGNIYAYFMAPGGNRYEMTTEMPRAADPSAEPVIWEDFIAAYSAWGQSPPESFRYGS